MCALGIEEQTKITDKDPQVYTNVVANGSWFVLTNINLKKRRRGRGPGVFARGAREAHPGLLYAPLLIRFLSKLVSRGASDLQVWK